MYSWYMWDLYIERVVCARESYKLPLSIQPTKSTIGKKVRRGFNRLLQAGHRWRGDVGVYN